MNVGFINLVESHLLVLSCGIFPGLGFLVEFELKHLFVLEVVWVHALKLGHACDGTFVVLGDFLLALIKVLEQQLEGVEITRDVLMDHI